MNCEIARTRIESGEESKELREHLRGCADCLELAVSREPAMLFTSLGNSEIEPPGGVELFVSEVMNEVRLRETEKNLDHPEHGGKVAWWWSAAAAIFILFTTWLAIQPANRPDLSSPASRVTTANATVETARLEPELTRPVVDEYDNAEAMIVELPSESVDDLKIVMIFDESLPQDL